MSEFQPAIEKVRLKNGLTLLLLPIPDSLLCSIHLCLAMGNLFESEKERGLSSLLQEVIVKGTQTKDAMTFNREIELLGASIESSSNHFLGRIAVEGPNEQIFAILALFFELIKSPALKKEEIEKEKRFLIDQLAALDDDPLKAALHRFKKAFYGTHPYGSSTLGEPDCLVTFTERKVFDWYRRWYVPNNMVIAVVGNFSLNRMKDVFLHQMGELIPQKVKPYQEDSFYPLSLRIVEQKDIQDSWMVYGFRAPSLFDVRGRAAFELLSNSLGGSMYSRLFLKVREELGLSYQVGSMYVPFIGPSFICAYAGFSYPFFEEIIQIFREEFHNLEHINPVEFEETKNYTLGMYLGRFETVYSLSSMISFYEKIGLGWDFPFKYQEFINNMSLEEALSIYSKNKGEGETLGAVVPSQIKK
ncbi:MAG: insulinase family protein [Candidatus Atribacteria bacterium]|nr:insulinase family protein [Candidatus Atribacteria bacterium]